MPTEPTPTLRDRLMSAGWTLYRPTSASDQDSLAAIQKQIEDAATAPLRAEVKKLTNDNILLKATADGAGSLLLDVQQEFVALKARSDALRLGAWSSLYGSLATPWVNLQTAINMYDAADRAGETPDHDDCPGGDCGCRRLVRDLFPEDASPTDTDAREGIDSRQAVLDGDAGEDLEEEGYSPELAIDGLFPYIEDFDERIAGLERWRDAIAKAQTDSDADLDRRIAALEAARTPVPVVTDAMVTAFWDAVAEAGTENQVAAYRERLGTDRKPAGFELGLILHGLKAALALAAGGTK